MKLSVGDIVIRIIGGEGMFLLFLYGFSAYKFSDLKPRNA